MNYPQYSNSLAEVTAVFPGAVYTPVEIKNYDEVGDSSYNRTRNGTVPATPDADGRYRVHLDGVLKSQVVPTVTVGGAARTLVKYGETVQSGQFAVSLLLGIVEFHSSDAGLAFQAVHTIFGGYLSAALIHQLQKEIAALETYAGLHGVNLSCYVHGEATTGALVATMALDASGQSSRTACRISVHANDLSNATATTVIVVTTAASLAAYEEGVNGIEITGMTSSADWCTTAVDWHVAVSGVTRLNVFCKSGGGHANLNISIEVR